MFPNIRRLAFSRQKKRVFMRGTKEKRDTHKINCAATILSQDSGFCSNHIFLSLVRCARFRGFRRPCPRFGKFSPNRISRRSLYRSLFGVQKGARLARSGRRRLVAPADASMIFSGGKTCRKLRALLPNMKDDRSSLSAGASSREWCVRQTRKKNTRCVRGRMRPGAPGARRDGAVRARRIPRAATSARFRGTVRKKSPLACAMRRAVAPSSRPAVPLLPRASSAASCGPTASA